MSTLRSPTLFALLPLLVLTAPACGSEAERPATVNGAPMVSVSASLATVDAGGTVQLAANATDADGDVVTYRWRQEPATPAGAFDDASSATPVWTAPTVTTSTFFTLRVVVEDGRGGVGQGSATVQVTAPVAAPNRAPVLSGAPTATPGLVVSGGTSTLAITATDPDGDTLAYAWSQVSPATPAGTFTDATTRTPSWTAPSVTAAQRFTFQVEVRDGRGGVTPAQVWVDVNPASASNQPPVVAATVTAPASLKAGDIGVFSISATDPDGDTLSYAWVQTGAAAQGTWATARTGSAAQWYSPVLSAQTSFTFEVSVTDGKSAPVVRTVSVPVAVPRFADVTSIFANACSTCHGTSGGLNLSPSSAYANLVDVSTQNPACNTLKRVAPGNPEASALVRKISGTTCGDRMPRNNPAYFADNPGLIVRVRSWVAAGAAND